MSAATRPSRRHSGLGQSPSLQGGDTQPRDVLRVGFGPRQAESGRPSRAAPISGDIFPWLRDGARRSVDRAAACSRPRASRFAGVGASRGCDVSGTWRSALTASTLSPSTSESTAHHPLSDRRFGPALAVLPRSERFQSRTAAMRQFFGDLLPEPSSPAARGRRSTEAFWNRHSLGVRRVMAGRGVDAEVVDLQALRPGMDSPRRLDARICSFRPPGSKALAQAEVVTRSSSRSVEASSPSQCSGRRSSQAGRSAIQEPSWVAWSHPPPALSARSGRRARGTATRGRSDPIAPRQEDPTRGELPIPLRREAEAPRAPSPPRHRATHRRRDAARRKGAGRSPWGPGRVCRPRSTCTARRRAPAQGQAGQQRLFPASRPPITAQAPSRHEGAGMEGSPDRTSDRRRQRPEQGTGGSTPTL